MSQPQFVQVELSDTLFEQLRELLEHELSITEAIAMLITSCEDTTLEYKPLTYLEGQHPGYKPAH